jgi:type II secretion system protein G
MFYDSKVVKQLSCGSQVREMRHKRKGFTLIELLIVVAIIAILAAIAVPNFLKAQTRAKCSVTRTDLRTVSVALEAYRTDCNAYPQAEINGTLKYLFWLTTPVAYLTNKNLRDPFTSANFRFDQIYQIPTYRYYGFNEQGVMNTWSDNPPAGHQSGELYSPRGEDEDARIYWFALFGHGPDRVRNNLKIGGFTGTFISQEAMMSPKILINFVYDPTNGTMSNGEMFLVGGSPMGASAEAARVIGRK